jgi:hypothetical protein
MLIEPDTLIKMCLNETCCNICICKHFSDAFPVQNGVKQGDALPPFSSNFALEYATGDVQETKEELELNNTHQFPVR